MLLEGFKDKEHIDRERRKARELRQGTWWSQKLGRGICHHCGGKFPRTALTMDHLTPVSRGGRSNKKNCVVSCKDCNSRKSHLFAVEQTFMDMRNSNCDETDHQ